VSRDTPPLNDQRKLRQRGVGSITLPGNPRDFEFVAKLHFLVRILTLHCEVVMHTRRSLVLAFWRRAFFWRRMPPPTLQ